ncbi:uncharacterized protein LOC111263707 isoform X2 [Varroa jacobsoni]|uniref:uncharacterized protein LOC111263707 isoform X2 n=1 Tax=Varroa jacobsoni TaxID=62625 RepID=UPI000BF33D8F|nr:uncharacterized protein LOC111263707 isoform X2 [Varroa jacobsoni]
MIRKIWDRSIIVTVRMTHSRNICSLELSNLCDDESSANVFPDFTISAPGYFKHRTNLQMTLPVVVTLLSRPIITNNTGTSICGALHTSYRPCFAYVCGERIVGINIDKLYREKNGPVIVRLLLGTGNTVDEVYDHNRKVPALQMNVKKSSANHIEV